MKASMHLLKKENLFGKTVRRDRKLIMANLKENKAFILRNFTVISGNFETPKMCDELTTDQFTFIK